MICAAAYAIFYRAATAEDRSATSGAAPELVWLKTAFRLSDAEYARVCQLHAGYVPHCREMCARIDRKNEEIRRLIAQSTGVTPAIEQALKDAARLRAECQTMMLKYFFEISRTMPAAEGKRYLEQMQAQTMMSTPRTPTRP
jgi:Heavy-metal resistance